MGTPKRHKVGFVVPSISARIVDGIERCGIPGCDPPVYRRGYCGRHFMEVWRTGSVTSPGVSPSCRACGEPMQSKAGGRKFCGPQCQNLSQRYGVTPEVHAVLRAATACQACALPGTYGGTGHGSLHVDHNHETKAIRGILDPGCNQALGLAGDSPIVLRRLAEFLRTTVGLEVTQIPNLLEAGRCQMCGRAQKVQARRTGKAVRYCRDLRCTSYSARLRDGFGMEPGQYRTLVERQGGRCAGCLTDLDNGKRSVVDHCHRTGLIRGVLHSPCNMAIGAVGESRERLEALALYVERPPMAADDSRVDEVA